MKHWFTTLFGACRTPALAAGRWRAESPSHSWRLGQQSLSLNFYLINSMVSSIEDGSGTAIPEFRGFSVRSFLPREDRSGEADTGSLLHDVFRSSIPDRSTMDELSLHYDPTSDRTSHKTWRLRNALSAHSSLQRRPSWSLWSSKIPISRALTQRYD